MELKFRSTFSSIIAANTTVYDFYTFTLYRWFHFSFNGYLTIPPFCELMFGFCLWLSLTRVKNTSGRDVRFMAIYFGALSIRYAWFSCCIHDYRPFDRFHFPSLQYIHGSSQQKEFESELAETLTALIYVKFSYIQL